VKGSSAQRPLIDGRPCPSADKRSAYSNKSGELRLPVFDEGANNSLAVFCDVPNSKMAGESTPECVEWMVGQRPPRTSFGSDSSARVAELGIRARPVV
jgi:hypothetical protein